MPESKKSVPRATRFPAEFRALVQFGGEKHWCVAVNLSRTGVLLMGDVSPPDTHEVDLVLMDPTGALRADLRGRIARVQRDEEVGMTFIALDFINIDAGQKEAIEILFSRAVEAFDLTSFYGAPDFEAIVIEVKKRMGKE